MRQPDVIVIGAGQAGLCTSYYLADRGIDHAVLERGVLGDSWAKRRWDSFTLVTPNWTVRLPGAEYRGPDPDGFMPRDDFVAYLAEWAARFGCPIRTGVSATRVRRGGNGRFRVDTADGPLEARAVVVATGTMQTPRRPGLADSVSSRVRQLDAETYRNPEDLAPGAVLIVGSGQTGGQIADDLRMAGRRVLLSVGGAGRVPRRYRGRDCVAWLDELGFFDRTPDMLDSPAHRFRAEIQISGARRGRRTIGPHRLRRDGVELFGKLTAGPTARKCGSPTTSERTWRVPTGISRAFREGVDAFVEKNGIGAPPPTAEELEGEPREGDGAVPDRQSIDLRDEERHDRRRVGDRVLLRLFLDRFLRMRRDGIPGDGSRPRRPVPGLYFMGPQLDW